MTGGSATVARRAAAGAVVALTLTCPTNDNFAVGPPSGIGSPAAPHRLRHALTPPYPVASLGLNARQDRYAGKRLRACTPFKRESRAIA